MSYKVLPQVILKTYKEFRNMYMKQNMKKDDIDPKTTNAVKCKSREITKITQNESNGTNDKKSFNLLTFCLIPFILAIHNEDPEKSHLMKFTDLPLYDCPEDEDQEDEGICCDVEPKIIQSIIYPYVQLYRCLVSFMFEHLYCWITYIVCSIYEAFKVRIYKIVTYMRDDENIDLRRKFTAFGTAAGILYGSRYYYVFGNIFFGGLAALLVGWLCFPKEIDIIIRNISYAIATNVVNFVNFVWHTDCDIIKLEKWGSRSSLCTRHLCSETDDFEECHLRTQIEEDLLTIKMLEKQKKKLEDLVKERLDLESEVINYISDSDENVECMNDKNN